MELNCVLLKCPLCQQIEPVKSMGWEPPDINFTAVKLVAVAFNSSMNTEPASRHKSTAY